MYYIVFMIVIIFYKCIFIFLQRVVVIIVFGMIYFVFIQRRFDVCIMDEVFQILQFVFLGFFFNVYKFVLVGDFKQFLFVVQSKEVRLEFMYNIFLWQKSVIFVKNIYLYVRYIFLSFVFVNLRYYIFIGICIFIRYENIVILYRGFGMDESFFLRLENGLVTFELNL